MKNFVWHCFNLLRTLSLILVITVVGFYCYLKVIDDIERNRNQAGLAGLTTSNTINPTSPFTILGANRPSRQQGAGRIPVSGKGFHLFFHPEEFIYSEHSKTSTRICLDDKCHPLKQTVTRDSMNAYLTRMGVQTSKEQGYVLNVDKIRSLESKKVSYKNNYKYYARMVNEDKIEVSQNSYPKIRNFLVNGSGKLVDE